MRITTSIIELLAFILTLSCGSAELSKKGKSHHLHVSQSLPRDAFANP